MDFMATLPDKTFDLAIVDPPYCVGADDGNFGRGGTHNGRKNEYRKDLKQYHSVLPDENYFRQLFRVSKNQIIWGSNYYPQYLYHSGAIVWLKKTYNILSDAEIAFQSLSKEVKVFDFRWAGFSKGKGAFEASCQQMIHPNQKPLSLYCWILKNYAKPGQTILDTHVGSGSIRIACHDLGFDFEGCELDPDYWQAQEDRYRRHIAQGELIGPEEVQALSYKQGEL
jgi:site-specific DNA-methyltransferase (adenine-specific)